MKLRSRSSRATGPKMRVPRGLFCGVDDHRGVLVEGDVGAVVAPELLLRAHDDGLDDLALLDRALRVGLLDRGGDDVADARVAPARAALHADAQDLARARVVGDLQAGLVLDHLFARSRTSTRRQRLVRDIGRDSTTRTKSPALASLRLVVGVQRRRGAHDLVVAPVAPRDVDAHGDRLVGLVGDDHAGAHLRRAGRPARRRACPGRARARGAWPSPARGGGGARRPSWHGARRAPRARTRGGARAGCARRPCAPWARSGERAPRRERAGRRRAPRPRRPAPRQRARPRARPRLGRRSRRGSSASGCSRGRLGVSAISIGCGRGRCRARGRSVSARARSRLAEPTPAVFSSSPVACWKRRPKTSRREVLMCSTSSSSLRSRSSLAFMRARPRA